MSKDNFSNPFAEAFKSFADLNNYSVDWEKWSAAARRNAKAISEANQAAAESFQAVARRQAEIFQQQAEDALRLVKDLIGSANSPEASIARQAEYLKSSVENNVANARELFEMASKSNIEAYDIANKQLNEIVSELSGLASAANSNKGSKKKDAA